MADSFFADLVEVPKKSDDANLLGGMSEESPVHALPAAPRSPALSQKSSETAPTGVSGLPAVSKEDARSANQVQSVEVSC